MENPVVETIKAAIKAHKAEIAKYEAMLKAYEIGKVPASTEHHYSGAKRGPKAGAKRGPYKAKKTNSIKSSFRETVESPNWEVEIPKVLKASGQALTTREIIDAIHPGSYSKTQRVLHGRCGAIISIYKKQGKLVKEAGLKNGFQAYMAI